ncbi:MAG: hypothetical protein RH948_10290 [Cyclobacteriaceae bacterium]
MDSNKISGSIASAIAFPCNATGIYYLQYTFEPGATRCGGSVLGFIVGATFILCTTYIS